MNKKYLHSLYASFLVLGLLLDSSKTYSQNTAYTQLYNSATFVKTIDLTKPVGEIAGTETVTGSGGVAYTIPIYTPPGTNGLQPSISIAYNSQGGAGIAGFGWNISGLSAISRTGKNMYHNGIVQPVKYTAADDAFLLDGMRLNAINGANGANGTIYAGESETFAKIISYATGSPNNPDWFQVIAKDGSIMEFGNSTDSRFLTDDYSSTIIWRINKIIDINGNYIEFKYDNSNRSSRIQQILYTGNINAGLLPYNRLNFVYSLRTDQSTGYEAGASIHSPYLLDKVEIIHTNDASANETIKTYKLNYGFDNVNSLLKEVIEFSGDESSASLNSTIFLYGDQPQTYTSIETTTIGSADSDLFSGDYDGDGISDILQANFTRQSGYKRHTDYSILNKFSNGSSGGMVYSANVNDAFIAQGQYTNLYNFFSADYNKDGRDDVLYVAGSLGEYNTSLFLNKVVLNKTTGTGYPFNSSGFTQQDIPYPISQGYHYLYIKTTQKYFAAGDFDGDGNQDYLLFLQTRPLNQYKAFFTSPGTGEVNLEINNFGVGTNPFVNHSYPLTICDADQIVPIDFNGDGDMELLIVKNNTTYVLDITRVSASSGFNFTASVIYSTATINKNCRIFPGDFNGDRKTDLLMHYDNNTWGILHATGVSFIGSAFSFQQTVVVNGYNVYDKIGVADFNGDGKSDIVHWYTFSNASRLSFYYSKGQNSAAPFHYEQYSYGKGVASLDLVMGDFNGDGRTDLVNRGPNSTEFLYIKPFGQERLLQKVTTGHNVTTAFAYKLLTDKSSYPYTYERTISLDDPVNKNPFNYVQLPTYALSAMVLHYGIGGNNTTEYKYENAVIHRAAKGFLGFKKVTAKNTLSGITSVSENEINTEFALLYPVKQTTRLTSTGQLLSESIINNSFFNLSTGFSDKRYFQKIDRTLSIDYLNGRASENTNTYDAFGNVTANISKLGYMTGSNITAIETTNTSTTFTIHNTPVPAKPDNITVTSTRAGMAPVSATNSYGYTTNGMLLSETSFYGLPKAVTTSFTYNSFGNPLSQTISSAGVSSRTTTYVYDSRGRYAIQKEIGSGTSIAQTESYSIDGKWGSPLSITSSDCLTTNNTYNGFGKLLQTTMPDGNVVTFTDAWLVNTNSLFYSKTDYAGGKPNFRIYYDRLGRIYKSEKASMAVSPQPPVSNEDFHTVLTTYDTKGNVNTTTNSFFPLKETPRITTSSYDIYNRPISSVNYMGTATVAYTNIGNGAMQVTATTPAGLVTSKTMDATGKIVSASDNGGQLNYSYDSRGNQTEVKHGALTVTKSIYDEYGRQISLEDKNAGITTYNYDGLGLLTSQTDSKGSTHNLTYDNLGRIITRSGPEGTTSYEYYKNLITGCSNNLISQITGFGGINKSYRYDALARLANERQTIDGIAYRTTYEYNTYSQVISKTFPSALQIFYEYDLNGYLSKLSTSAVVRRLPLFSNGSIDGEVRYKNYTLANNLITTNTYNNDFPATSSTPGVQNLNYSFQYNTGNLMQRTDVLRSQTENFGYDNLNRLTSATVNGLQQFGITYDGTTGDSKGNINSKTDAGYYTYKTDKVHAVAFTMNTPAPGQNVVSPAPNSAMPHAEQVISYTPFIKTASIVESGLTLAFEYGPEYERVKTTLTNNGAITDTRLFVGDYEKQITPGGTREIHYINGGDGLCAMVIIENGGIAQVFPVYKDHLGSIVTLTDLSGAVVAEQNFDAWGRRRTPSNWNNYFANSSTELSSVPAWLYRGYTGHEMLTKFTLINMNGRMYDPILGRMISPDNYIPTPHGTQGYNRYTYAMNNPLSYTDPDGNNPLILIPILIGAFVKGMQYDMSGQGTFLGGFWRGAAVGAATAYLGGIGGGSFLGNVAWGAGEGVLANGISNALDGEAFFDGAGKAAILGGAFAAVTSGIESVRNDNDGYGFGTNKGRLDAMIDDYNSAVGPSNKLTTGNRAISFVKDRYGLSNANFSFNLNESNFGSTALSSGDISIGSAAFQSSSIFKATMIHEYWHSTVDRVLQNGRWSFALDRQGYWNNQDGVGAYASEIRNAGRMHISSKALSQVSFLRGNSWTYGSTSMSGSFLVNPVWYAKGVIKSKWWYLIPKRF